MTSEPRRTTVTGGASAEPSVPPNPTSKDVGSQADPAFDFDSNPAIVFDKVTVQYRRNRETTTALADFDLRVAVGETVALLGPSGSGKSTALKALAGFVPIASGRVRVGGRDVTSVPPAKRGIGVVVQSYALFPHMTVAKNVAYGLAARRVRKSERDSEVAKALEIVDMARFGSRYPSELSGGQQQRVAIARALAIRPDVLLLDEPLAALDARLREDMVAELAALKSQLPRMTMLYVTHDQREALALANHIAVMRDSRLVDVGTVDQLWNRPSTGFTAQFLGGANLIPATIGTITGRSVLAMVGDGSGGPTVEATLAAGASNSPQWLPGTPVLLCIRPYAVELAALGAERSLPATVQSSVWHGSSTRVVVNLDRFSDPVTVDCPGQTSHRIGQRVGVRLPADHITLVSPS